MEDNEIIKALKEILEIMLVMGDLQKSSTISKTIDYINRQKAEIERLNNKQISELASASALFEMAKIKDEQQRINNKLKADAIKEFAERLKEKSSKMELVCSGALVKRDYTIDEKTLNNLAKEMVGEKQ